MSQLDYMLVSQFFISVILAVIFVVVWRSIERKQYTLLWALVFVVMAVRIALYAVMEWFPNPDIHWLVVGALFLLMQGLFIAGFRLRAGKQAWPPTLIIFLAGVELAVIFFTLVFPHAGLQVALVPFSAGLIMFAVAKNVTLPDRPSPPAERGAMVMFVLSGLSLLTAAAVGVMQGREPDPFYLDLYRQVTYLAQPAAMTGTGLFTVLLLAHDLAERMKILAITDQLTDVPNRRGFEESAGKAIAMAQRKQTPTCVVVADIDKFKGINDAYGHLVGDHAIVTFTGMLLGELRNTDIIGRIGGEEFVILMQDTNLQTCQEVTERLRQSVEQQGITFEKHSFDITASFGITRLTPEMTLKEAIHEADQALYAAKDAGRNQVAVYGV